MHDRPLLRVHIASCLWLDSPERRAVANLRTVLWRLRRPGCELVETTTTHLALAPAVAVDVRQQRAVIGRLLERDASPPSEDVERMADGGELLPDWYDDWVLVERERFRQLRLHALEAPASGSPTAGRYADAGEAGLAAVARRAAARERAPALIRVAHGRGQRGRGPPPVRPLRGLLRDQLGLGRRRCSRGWCARYAPRDGDVTRRLQASPVWKGMSRRRPACSSSASGWSVRVPTALRARITATTDVRRPPTVSAAGGADDVLEAVRRWLGAFTAGSDDGQEPPLTLK